MSIAPRLYWTATDLLAAEFPEPRWAIPGIVPEGLTLLAGPPKVGKSWLTYGLAVAVATGGCALGSVPVDRGHVLCLSLEDTARRLQDRLRVLLRGDQAPAGLSLALGWPRLDEGGDDKLDALLAEHPECRLVIVDTLAKVRARPGRGTDNLYASDYAAAGALKEVADRHGIALVAVHHVRKASADDFLDTISGTHGLAGAADTVAVLRRSRNAADAVLHITGRDVEEAERALSFSDGMWSLLDGPATDYSLGDTRRRILAHLRVIQGQGATPKQIATTLALDYELTKKTCRRMADDDQLDTAGNGLYTLPLSHTPPLSPLSLVSPERDSRDSRDRDRRGFPA